MGFGIAGDGWRVSAGLGTLNLWRARLADPTIKGEVWERKRTGRKIAKLNH